ncbi:MAG: DUF134 domain-containing protein [Desulfatitalea sp.]|nr:DUF134 domain-containing protein [Desulfatitalea sp.]
MPRPRKCRKINTTPGVTYFKPRGVPMRDLSEVYMPLEGFEAIRLADYEGLNHEAAALQMHVSRQTFGRILASARNTVGKALVEGLALRIHGGHYRMAGATHTEELEALVEDPASAAAVCVPATDTALLQTSGGAQWKEGVIMTKIAITSEGPTLEDRVDPRFGRAAGFVVVDPETLAFSYVENGEAQVRAQGAGIQAAETVSRAGAEAVLTGFVGPKAFQALSAAGIRVAQDLDNLSVREAVERYKSGALRWSDLGDAKGKGV